MRVTSSLMLLVAGGGLAACSSDEPRPTKPTYRGGGGGVAEKVTCADLGLGSYSTTIEAPDSRTYGLDAAIGGRNTVSLFSPDGVSFSWNASLAIDAVIVKGGPSTNLYTYNPEAIDGDGLASIVDPATGVPYPVSHLDFCFDYELAVTKTASASFTRSYAWSIDKTSPVSKLELATGAVVSVPYTVEVKVTGYTDRDYGADGTVRIHNPAPFSAMIARITDELGGEPVALDCGIALPFELDPNATLVCTYHLALAGPHGASASVQVETSGPVGPGSAQATLDFDRAAMAEVDRCVEVTDDRVGTLGHPCTDASFSYHLDVGPYECPASETFVNHASFTASDTGATDTACWAVAVVVSSPKS